MQVALLAFACSCGMQGLLHRTLHKNQPAIQKAMQFSFRNPGLSFLNKPDQKVQHPCLTIITKLLPHDDNLSADKLRQFFTDSLSQKAY